jgi:hypothetical protein
MDAGKPPDEPGSAPLTSRKEALYDLPTKVPLRNSAKAFMPQGRNRKSEVRQAN